MIGVQTTWAGFWRRRAGRGRKPLRTPNIHGNEANVHGNDADANKPLVTAIGTGGHVVLMRDHVILTKNHFLGDFINVLGLGYGKIQKTIMLDDISSVSIIRPMFFPSFIVFSYPGGPSISGSALADALMSNALIMNIFDNRPFYELKQRIQSLHQMRNQKSATPSN